MNYPKDELELKVLMIQLCENIGLDFVFKSYEDFWDAVVSKLSPETVMNAILYMNDKQLGGEFFDYARESLHKRKNHFIQ